MNMNLRKIFPHFAVLSLFLSTVLAQAASMTGTVTNKTTGKPSAGDTVTLIDVQAGMADAATATTDAKGHYSLESPSGGGGAFLIKATHQGGTYFIAAPQGGGPGDITVYDVAAKVEGVAIDAEMILAEAAGGMVRVQERYLVRNTSLPPRAQFSSNTFEFAIPAGALLDAASATRPGGLPTNTRPTPLGEKGYYTINIPIQPDQGEKETLFEVQYHLSYSGKVTFSPRPQMPADNLVVYVPKGMTFGGAKGADFQPTEQDPRVQTFVAKNIRPGQAVEFTLSGEGQMPRDAQNAAMGQQIPSGMGDAGGSAETGSRPGGGIGTPIDTPDPLTKYKWWMLGGLALLLVAAAAYMLRKQGALATGGLPATLSDAAFETRPVATAAAQSAASYSAAQASYAAAPAGNKAALLNILKDELFAIESEKLSGTLSPAEYAEVKAGLEAVLKRALKS
jgi:hypothetical protein